MKKIISFLASLSLLSTSSTLVVSCTEIYGDCFDQNGNNVTDKGSDQKQWNELIWMPLVMTTLQKEKITDASIFQTMNNKNSDELSKNYLFTNAQNETWKFNYNFTFLITTYNSINKDVISQMQNDLINKNSGIYLFLNLPRIDINNIENEQEIDFQFLFMIKDKVGNIIGNNNNSWFYWYDCNMINILPNNTEFFFNLKEKLSQERVVTNFYSE